MLAVWRGVVRPWFQDMEEDEVPDPRDLADAVDGPLCMGREVGGEEHPGEHTTKWWTPGFLNPLVLPEGKGRHHDGADIP